MLIKTTWGITSHQSEWPSSIILQIINAGQDMEEREPSCPVGRHVNGYSHYGEGMYVSLKSMNKTTI